MDAVGRKRNCDMADAMGTSGHLVRKTQEAASKTMADFADTSDKFPVSQCERRRMSDLQLAFRCGLGNCEGARAVAGPGDTGALACQSCLPGGGSGCSDVCGRQRIAVEFRTRTRRRKRNLKVPLRDVNFTRGRNSRPSSQLSRAARQRML